MSFHLKDMFFTKNYFITVWLWKPFTGPPPCFVQCNFAAVFSWILDGTLKIASHASHLDLSGMGQVFCLQANTKYRSVD